MNKSLIKQMKATNKKYYNTLDLETLTDYCLELSKPRKDFKTFTGKKGVLEYLKSLYKGFGYKEHKIRVKLLKDNIDLKEGCYQIGDLGIKYYR
jgi:hypothetical protein